MPQREAEKSERTKNKASPGQKKTSSEEQANKELGWISVFREHRNAFLWVFLTFLVTFALFLISLVPAKVDLVVGQVAPMDVKATREGIDEFATKALIEKVLADVSEVWDSNPKVLEDTKALFQEMASKVQTLAETEELSTQYIINELRPYLDDSISDEDILAVVATSPIIIEESFDRAWSVVEEVLTRGLKPENVEKGKEEICAIIRTDKSIPEHVGRLFCAFVGKNLQPNLTLNKEETDKKIKMAIESVEPVKIRRGDYIVRRGDIVTEEQIAILEKMGMMGSSIRITEVLGALLSALIFCGFTAAYVGVYNTDLIEKKGIPLIASVVILSLVVLKILCSISGFLAPVAFGVMLSSTLWDRKFGTFFAAALSIAVGVMTGFDVVYMTVAITSGIAAALAVKQAWNRAQILQAGLVVSVVSVLTYGFLVMAGALATDDVGVWRDILFVVITGPLSSVLAVGSLPVFESVFDIITPLKLIELSNPEQPLLHRLLLEAPGTYHHSIMVGNLAEAAAWAIGADSLLTRVGAYYHDVGKFKRPYFFSENQMFGMDNPHDKMSPSLSATVIMAHVKDGVELAKEYNLPEVIIDFIREHHGTTLVSYFYAKAAEDAEAGNHVNVDEWSFRYEGPRPSSKETAIVMLADSIEAAARSLSNPNPARMETLVRRMIQDRLMDHQLDKCDLTLKELDIIGQTFTQVLLGLFHRRIEYPTMKIEDDERGQ